jgi:exodeoxyribonuclease VII small subunit
MAKEPKKSGGEAEELPPFEKSLEQLEEIVHAIESGDVSLEQSLSQYERGMKLIRHCRSILERAESRIKTLTVDDKGQVVAKDDE